MYGAIHDLRLITFLLYYIKLQNSTHIEKLLNISCNMKKILNKIFFVIIFLYNYILFICNILYVYYSL